MPRTVVQRSLMRPVRLVPLAFLAVITLGTGLLKLPLAHAGEVQPLAAAFTAVSATCITGLTVVDTATYWTPFGKAVIILLTQMGGFGIMSAATLLALLIKGRVELSGSLVAQTETQTQSLGDVTRILRRIAVMMGGVEIILGLVLTARFFYGRELDLGSAAGRGFFYACAAFTNAGFAMENDSIMGFVTDPWIVWPLCLGVILGSLGYPVVFELWQRWRHPHMWSVHTRITFYGWLALMVVGITAFIVFEWTNPNTLGPLSVAHKANAALAGGVMPRSAGFNIVDYAYLREETVLVTLVLMFIGGGSAGTSGGLKVSTFFLLAFVILSEVRGEPEVTIAHRRIGHGTQRQALAVALLSIGAVTVGAIILVMLTSMPLVAVVFDIISAFGTVGLSLGITSALPEQGQFVLMVLMFVGRVGTITVASALALRVRHRHYHLPEERPIVG